MSPLQTTVQNGLLTHVNVNEHLQFIVTGLHCYRNLDGTVCLRHFSAITAITTSTGRTGTGSTSSRRAAVARCSGAANAGDAPAAAGARDCTTSHVAEPVPCLPDNLKLD